MAHKLRVGRPFKVGLNTWYFASRRGGNGILKVRHGVIQEIGLANRLLTTGRARQRHFLRSFYLAPHLGQHPAAVAHCAVYQVPLPSGWNEAKASCEYGGRIDIETRKPRRTAVQLARAVDGGRNVGAALRHLDAHGSEPGAVGVAEALARFLVARCDSHHAGWRVVRQVVVDSAADAPWEKCARRAVPLVASDLLSLSSQGGRTQLAHAQHVAAQRRVEQIAVHVDQAPVLADLGLTLPAVTAERWQRALSGAVGARSREQVARAVDLSLRG